MADLYLNIWLNQGEIPETLRTSLVDTDGDGFTDDIFGWNFCNDANEVFAPNNPSDNLGHGIHVAGTIGAIGNNARRDRDQLAILDYVIKVPP
ncbi:MAG: S8 family serine peptidase [Pirellula sp.]